MGLEMKKGTVLSLPKGYKQTEVGLIPVDWEVKKVSEIFEIHNNNRLPINEEERKKIKGKYPYYGPTKIQDYINEYRFSGRYALIGEDGDHFLKWKSMSMTQLASGKFNVNNHAHILRGTKVASTNWFYYFFSHRDITSNLTRQGAGRYKLTKAALLTLPCALPPTLAEQKAIATALSDVDSLISSLNALIAKKKAIKQGAMQQLLTPPHKGGKRLDGFDGEWVETSLGEFAKINMGQSPLSSNYNTNSDGLPLVQGNADINNRKTIIRNYTSQITKKADKGDIIMSVRAPVGEIAIASFDCCIGRGVCSLKSNNDFLYQFLVFFETSWAQFSTGSTFDSINSNQLKELTFFAPVDEDEQKAIAQILSDMDEELEELTIKKEKYEHIKQGMMQELLAGKTRLV